MELKCTLPVHPPLFAKVPSIDPLLAPNSTTSVVQIIMNVQMMHLSNRLHLSRSTPCASLSRRSGCCTSGRASHPTPTVCFKSSVSTSVSRQTQTEEQEHVSISAVAQEQASGTSTGVISSSIQSRCGVLVTGIVSWVLQSQFSALADDDAALAEVTNVLVALDGGNQKMNDFLISIVFTLVIAALSIVTLGVSMHCTHSWSLPPWGQFNLVERNQ